MIDTKKIRARMTLLGIRYKDLAEAWKCAPGPAYQKITGRRNISLREANILAQLLNLSDKEYYEFLFAIEIA